MLSVLLPTPTPGRAAAILREVFGGLPGAFAFRLWDGQEVRLGTGAPAVIAVIKSPETFLSLIRDPTPYNFAECYVQSCWTWRATCSRRWTWPTRWRVSR